MASEHGSRRSDQGLQGDTDQHGADELGFGGHGYEGYEGYEHVEPDGVEPAYLDHEHLDHDLGQDFGHDDTEPPADDLPVFGDPPDRPRRRRRPRWRGIVVILLALGLLGGAVYGAYGVLGPWVQSIREPNDYPGPGDGSAQVTINQGETGKDIGDSLVKVSVVKTTKAFTDAAGANPKSSSIQPGTYSLKEHMKAADVVTALLDPANRAVPQVTVREGLWASEIFALLSQKTGVPVAQYQAAAKDPALGLPAAANGNIEGFLYPDTYAFPASSTALQQLQMMVGEAKAEFAKLGVPDAQLRQVVITASIVQAEGRLPADMPKVARVIDNRLAVNMPLQLDSTVSYAVQRRALTTTDAERATKNPDNTYLNPGLPATPISNPGADALTAALHPADGPWIYFVTVNPATGETVFSVDAAGHNAAVAQFQQWCQQNKGQC